MTDKNNPDALWLMLGEIRGDLKWPECPTEVVEFAKAF